MRLVAHHDSAHLWGSESVVVSTCVLGAGRWPPRQHAPLPLPAAPPPVPPDGADAHSPDEARNRVQSGAIRCNQAAGRCGCSSTPGTRSTRRLAISSSRAAWPCHRRAASHLWGRRRGVVVSTCMLSHAVSAISGHQCGHQWPSVAVGGHQPSSAVIHCHHQSSVVTHVVIRSHQRSSVVIRGHQ